MRRVEIFDEDESLLIEFNHRLSNTFQLISMQIDRCERVKSTMSGEHNGREYALELGRVMITMAGDKLLDIAECMLGIAGPECIAGINPALVCLDRFCLDVSSGSFASLWPLAD